MKHFLFAVVSLSLSLAGLGQENFSTIQNKYTRSNIEYLEVTTDLTGRPFPAGYVPDGVLHVKRNGKIFRAQSETPNRFKASWFGIVPGKDAVPGFERIKATFPKEYPVTLTFEIGRYVFSKPVEFSAMTIELLGTGHPGWGSHVTQFFFEGEGGLVFKNCTGANLENIMVFGSDKGRGISVSSVMSMKNVMITHFAKGMELWGDIENGNGSNASRSIFHTITISVCKEYGLRMVGGDANQCSFYDLDIRDIEGVGLIDASFLGNTYYSAHFNNCKGGALKVTDPNSVVSFYDVYMEDGMPPSVVTANTSFFGARTFATQIQGGMVQRGRSFGNASFTDINISGSIKLQTSSGGSWGLYNRGNLWEFNFSNINHTKLYLLQPGVTWRGEKMNAPSVGQEYPHKITPMIK